jgi:hypothetical protein
VKHAEFHVRSPSENARRKRYYQTRTIGDCALFLRRCHLDEIKPPLDAAHAFVEAIKPQRQGGKVAMQVGNLAMQIGNLALDPTEAQNDFLEFSGMIVENATDCPQVHQYEVVRLACGWSAVGHLPVPFYSAFCKIKSLRVLSRREPTQPSSQKRGGAYHVKILK